MRFIDVLKSGLFGLTCVLFSTQYTVAQCDTIIADFSSNAPRCTGASVDFVFTQNAYTTLTYSWNFGSGASPATSTAQNPTGITYSTPGLKLVTLTITHPGLGCTDVKTAGVNIIETPNPSFSDNGPQCEEAEVNFTYTGSTGTGWVYDWDFGSGANPAVSSAQSPSGVKYFSPGTKSVTLTVTNGQCVGSVSQNVTIQNKPDAGFSTVSNACTADSLTFTNTGSTGLSYSWDFGSGASPATSSNENPTNIFYSTSGAKSVRQIVTQGACSDTSYQSVTAIQTPNPSFTSTAPQCEGSEVDFTYTGSTAVGWSYAWDLGTGASPNVSTAQSPQGVVYSGFGTKSVNLVVTNLGCSESVSQNIGINETPSSGISSSSPACTGDSVNFSNTGSTGLTYSWNFGSGASPATSTLENPLGIVYSTSGIKNIQQVVVQGTCTDTSFYSLNVTESPQPNFTHNAPQCEGAEVNFNYTGTTGSSWTYLWDFGTGSNPSLSAGVNPGGIEYSGAGTKTISLTVTNQLCSESTTQTITINPTPTAGFSSNAPSCTGDSVNFLNTGSSGLTYAYNFGAGASPSTSTNEDPLGVIYSTPGTKNVRQIITQGSCRDTAYLSFTIGETPVPSFTSTAPQCQGAEVSFSYTGSTGSGWTYLWDFGSGSNPSLSASSSPGQVTYSSSGTKNVLLTVTNQLCSESVSQNITINPTPVAGFTSNAPGCTGDSVNFQNSGSSGLTYDWNFGSGASPATGSSENPVGVIYSTAGIKTVRQVIIQGTCSDTSISYINVRETPSVSFTNNGPKCEGADVNFTYTGSTGSGWLYSWDFGTGSTPSSSTGISPQGIQYAGAGNKLVTLTVNNQGCIDTSTNLVQIDFQPTASFSSNTPTCTGDSVQFTNTGTTGIVGTTYAWAFPGGAPGTSSSENPAGVTFATDGVSSVQFVVTVGTCADSATNVITINKTPDISILSNAPVCAFDPVNFSNQGSSGSRWNYIWDFGPGSNPSISTSENPGNIKFNTGGNKKVSLSISDANCGNTDTVQIQIYNLPVSFAGDDTMICADRCVQLGDSAQAGNSYSWFPSSTLDNDTLANPTACPKASINVYTLTTTDGNGCVSMDTVTVSMLPSAIANAGPDIAACEGDSAQIGAALIEGQTYRWEPALNLSSDSLPSPIAMPDTTTTYKVFVSYKGCEEVSDEMRYTVYMNPIVSAGDDVTIAEGESTQLLATGGIMYIWSPAASLSNAGIFNPIASPLETTAYVVEVTDQNSCQNYDSVIVTVVEAEIWAPDAFTPNDDGANDVFYVRSQGATRFVLNVYNRGGDLIFTSSDPANGWDGRRQGSGEKMPPGAYVYSTKGQLSNGEPFSRSGVVNLIR